VAGEGAPLVIFDLERTGPDPLTDRIVEVAALKVSPDGSVAAFESRVNPGVKIPSEATAVHGITDADVADAPSFATVAPDLAAFLEGCDLAGYNLRGFDIPLLGRELDRVKVPFSFDGRRVVDAQVIYFRKGTSDPYSSKQCVFGGGSAYSREIHYPEDAGASGGGGPER